jgi:hypothetical protein
MALLVMLMPTNYRAGTETPHAHAFFQEMIDLVVGHTHEHGEPIGTVHTHADDNGASHSHSYTLGIGSPSVVAAITTTSSAPDVPHVSELTPSVEKANAILILATLLSAFGIAGWRRRALWSPERALQAVVHLVEAPPPRLAGRDDAA